MKPPAVSQPTPPSHQDKRTLLQAMAWAEKQYHHCLLNSPEADAARRYLQERGITAESIERFHLGFSPLERDWILRQRLAAKASPRAHDASGEDVGGDRHSGPAGGRRQSLRPLQGPAAVFHPRRPGPAGGHRRPGVAGIGHHQSRKVHQFAGNAAVHQEQAALWPDLARETLRKTRTALVMEGYTDVIVAHQFGFQNAVAVLGTALGESHIRILKAHADRIVLVLDGDEAGTRRANEVLELFVAEQADLRILTLPEGLDPCDYLHKYGAGGFSDLLATKAVDALDHAFRGEDPRRSTWNGTFTAPARRLEELIAIVAQAPRLRHDTTRDARFREEKILQRLAARFRVDEREVRRRLTALRRASIKPRPAGSPLAASQEAAAKPPAAIDPWERELLELLVAHPECIESVRGRIAAGAIGRRAVPADLRDMLSAGRSGPCAHVRPADAGVRRAGRQEPVGGTG